MTQTRQEMKPEEIAKIIDPNNTFLEECEEVCKKRFGENFRGEMK